jgi:hypothetical protein
MYGVEYAVYTVSVLESIVFYRSMRVMLVKQLKWERIGHNSLFLM